MHMQSRAYYRSETRDSPAPHPQEAPRLPYAVIHLDFLDMLAMPILLRRGACWVWSSPGYYRLWRRGWPV